MCERMRRIDGRLIAIWHLTGGERDPAGVTSRSVCRVYISLPTQRDRRKHEDIKGKLTC